MIQQNSKSSQSNVFTQVLFWSTLSNLPWIDVNFTFETKLRFSLYKTNHQLCWLKLKTVQFLISTICWNSMCLRIFAFGMIPIVPLNFQIVKKSCFWWNGSSSRCLEMLCFWDWLSLIASVGILWKGVLSIRYVFEILPVFEYRFDFHLLLSDICHWMYHFHLQQSDLAKHWGHFCTFKYRTERFLSILVQVHHDHRISLFLNVGFRGCNFEVFHFIHLEKGSPHRSPIHLYLLDHVQYCFQYFTWRF